MKVAVDNAMSETFDTERKKINETFHRDVSMLLLFTIILDVSVSG